MINQVKIVDLTDNMYWVNDGRNLKTPTRQELDIEWVGWDWVWTAIRDYDNEHAECVDMQFHAQVKILSVVSSEIEENGVTGENHPTMAKIMTRMFNKF